LEGQRPSSAYNTLVFISYAREDSDAAKRLYEDFKKANLNPWLDKNPFFQVIYGIMRLKKQ
jgi:hypothetical protein